jgi:hypothetical protein
LGVVDEARQRALARHLGEQAERGERDQEAVGRRTRGEPERHAQRGLLRLVERVQPVEHRRAQLVQPRERELHLGLDSRDARDPEAGGLLGAVLQQGGLADARLAVQHEHAAVAAADALQQLVEEPPLGGSAQQHRRAASGHDPGNLDDPGQRPWIPWCEGGAGAATVAPHQP